MYDELGKRLCVDRAKDFSSKYAEPFDPVGYFEEHPNVTYLEMLKAESDHQMKHAVQSRELKDICDNCPFLYLGKCQESALQSEYPIYGVVGGLTELERHKIRVVDGDPIPLSSPYINLKGEARRKIIDKLVQTQSQNGEE